MSARSFVRMLNEMKLQRDPAEYYRPFDPREKVDYTPQRAQHSQSISLNDLFQAAQVGARSLGNIDCQITRYLGDNGFLMTCTLAPGNFQGQPVPNSGAIESAIAKQLLRTYPSARCDLIDVDEIGGMDPMMHRRRIHLRIRRGPTVSEVK